MKVSLRAVIRRINCRIYWGDAVLKKARPRSQAQRDFGDYYIFNRGMNCLIESNIDVEEFARRFKCLSPHETVRLAGGAK